MAPRLWRGRPVLLFAALALAALIPVGALAVANDWWFLGAGSQAPAPATAPVVVTSGTWSGHAWELVAYRTADDGICFTVTPSASARSNGVGAAMNCGGFSVAAGASTSADLRGITYLSGSTPQLPTYIAGPVVDAARTVVVYFANDEVLRIPTVSPPASFGAVRFYVSPVPESVRSIGPRQESFLLKLVGLDGNKKIVACLAVPPAKCG